MRRTERGEALLRAAASQLADLPSAVDTELRPPVVILDASRSANGVEVMAVCTASPNDPAGPINLVTVPAGNSRFRGLGVRSGDILKYYVLEDETVDEERRQAGFAPRLAMEFTVAQVLDDNTLLIEKGIPERIVKNYMAQLVDDQTLSAEGAVPRGILIPSKIEIWRNLDDRLIEIHEKLVLYADRRLPAVGWQPSPDEHAISQIVTWLNQWLRQSEPKTDWGAAATDPLLDTLDGHQSSDEALAPYISDQALSAQAFQPYDGRLLQEAVWHRDIARWAQGANFNDVDRATALFDWTVRNVQLVADEEAAAHRPWQVLLYGRGSAKQRAWVFAMLCRQQGLDVVMLATSAAESKFWLPALLVEDQLYLFDTRLGLPIPAAGGEGIATLQQIREDDSLLRQLDLEGMPYPVTADALANVVPQIVADPFDLTRRARQVESKLTGDDHLVLTSRPSELAERLKSIPQLADARLWDLPFRTLRDQLTLSPVAARRREALAFEPFAIRPVLWKARTRHFQGRRSIDEQSEEETIDDHREAAQLYTNKSVRPTDRDIAQTASVGERRVDMTAKLNAAYWIGLLSFDDERYDVAAHWLGRPELSAAESPWGAGARYNLARTLEAQEKLDEAIKLLEQDTSPQRHGNMLRVRALKKRLEESKQAE
ncbi:MAG: CDC27 family protein [Pirellulales bacterium]